MDDWVKEFVDELWNLTDEMYAREFSSNSVYEQFGGKSWNDLCNRVIQLAAKLKNKNRQMDLELHTDDEHYGYYSNIADLIDDLIYLENLPEED